MRRSRILRWVASIRSRLLPEPVHVVLTTVITSDNWIWLRASVARHSIWFNLDAEVTDFIVTTPNFMTPVLEPRVEDLPQGTSLTVDYRGASMVTGPGVIDALALDAFGDDLDTVVTFLGGTTWRSSISQIDGARFFQMRFTFVSNTETGLSPTLSALGVSLQQ